MKLLLIRPKGQEGFWEMDWYTQHLLGEKRNLNAPLSLAAVAALTPSDWDIQIVDEFIEDVPHETDADIVGITGTNVEYPRQIELLKHFKGKAHTVAGGPYVSLVPELYHEADTVVCGEAEYVWPQFCAEWPNVNRFYKSVGTVNMADVPVPRYDLLKLERYVYIGIQFSRGCPYRCEFCDVPIRFGHKPRMKDLSQVEEELALLRDLGVRNVFFVDDNLIGNKPAARELLDLLIRVNDGMNFGTQASLNLAQDHDLMTAMRAANFEWIFCGIESSDLETLKATKKHQNARMDPLTAVYEIYRHGIQIYGGFIVGFDEDEPDTFLHQYNFIMDSGIQVAQISPLFAVPKTPLYNRLKAEGRIRFDHTGGMETTQATNIIPKRMSVEDLLSGHAWLYNHLFTHDAIDRRVRIKSKYLVNPVHANEKADLATVARMKAALPFWARPRDRVEAKDWCLGLGVRDYVERNFGSNGP